jgi:hypothetical protein
VPRFPRSAGPLRGERPDQPFTGYKLAHAVLSADGARTGFAGLTLGAERVYGVTAEASCVWNRRHLPPRRWCGCGFYCLHALSEARALGCATDNRSALLIEIAASGRYIRYERGLRYSRQRVRAISGGSCGCGRPGIALADAGSGLIGWRHLAPVCGHCAAGRAVLSLPEFAALLDGPVRVELVPTAPGAPGAPAWPMAGSPADGWSSGDAAAQQSPIAVLTAEIALLHARLDHLQARLDR